MVILGGHCPLIGCQFEPISSWGIVLGFFTWLLQVVFVVCKISYQVKPELLLFIMSNKGLRKKEILIQTILNTGFT